MVLGANTNVNCEDCANISNDDQTVGIGFPFPSGAITGSLPGTGKLYVSESPANNGNSAFFDGDVYSTGNFNPSDMDLKNNVINFNGASVLLNQLSPKTYDYYQNLPTLNLPDGNQIGLLAQDVENILPSLVKEFSSAGTVDGQGNAIEGITFKGINYAGMVPVLIQGFKEQTNTIESLQEQINDLSALIANCCAQPRTENPTNASITLSNHESIILNQNVPNPFAEQTVITYDIPESVKAAKIMFYDLDGKILKIYNVEHRGAGQLTVYGADLSSGIYTYSLIADDKLIETKKMNKQ